MAFRLSGSMEKVLFVQGLNTQVPEDEVKKMFEPFGQVENVHLVLNPMKQKTGCGFVVLSDSKVAWIVIRAFDGFYTMKGCENPLSVRFAHEEDFVVYNQPHLVPPQNHEEYESCIVVNENSRDEHPLILHELLNGVKPYITNDVRAPQLLEQTFQMASRLAVDTIRKLAISVDDDKARAFHVKYIAKILPSEIFGPHKHLYAGMIVDAILETQIVKETRTGTRKRCRRRCMDDDEESDDESDDGDDDDEEEEEDSDDDVDDELGPIGICKVPGGTSKDSFLVKGFAFRKISCDRQQPASRLQNPKILMLESNVDGSISKKEIDTIKHQLAKSENNGATIVLSHISHLAIRDVVTKYFEKRDILHISVSRDDLYRVKSAVGGTIHGLRYLKYVTDKNLGTCEVFEETSGEEAETCCIIRGCSSGNMATIILRGDDQFIEKAEKILHEEIPVGKINVRDRNVVVGGGAVYLAASRVLFEKEQAISSTDSNSGSKPFLKVFAKALEVASTEVVHELSVSDGTSLLHDPSLLQYLKDSLMEDREFWWEPVMEKINAVVYATDMAINLASFVNICELEGNDLEVASSDDLEK